VRPGDLIAGDIDGVLAVPRDHVAEIVRLALAKVEGEGGVRRMIESGESTADIFEKTGILWRERRYFTASPVSANTSFPLRRAMGRL
jgi:hypothetical protein